MTYHSTQLPTFAPSIPISSFLPSSSTIHSKTSITTVHRTLRSKTFRRSRQPLPSPITTTTPPIPSHHHHHSHNQTETRRNHPKMLGPFFPNLGDSKLLKSEIVRQEMMSLESDYTHLAKLGHQYNKFDREGKQMFVDRAFDVVDRYNIFLTRLKLTDDFSSQMFVKQYQVKLAEFGLTMESLMENTKKSLQMMRDEIPDG